MKLQQQVQTLARAYVRKGGKDNRRQQAARMLAFAAHSEAQGAHEMGQVGGRHVMSYWKALRASGGLADSTLYSHWLAIRELWRLAGKPGEPPRPFKAENNQQGGPAPKRAGGRSPRGAGGPQAPPLGVLFAPLRGALNGAFALDATLSTALARIKKGLEED